MTSETNNINPYNSKYGVIEYIADGVILLRQVRQNDLQSVATVIEVSKMRRIEHSKDIKPYSITKNGIVVHSEAEVFS
ncbi:MAG: ATPase domain-containing protein [Candidatus Methanoperedens sp.]